MKSVIYKTIDNATATLTKYNTHEATYNLEIKDGKLRFAACDTIL